MSLEDNILIDLYPDGKIIIHNPKEKDICFKEFKEMMICTDKLVNYPEEENTCKKKINLWNKCIKISK